MFHQVARISTIGWLALLVAGIAGSWIGLLPEAPRVPLITIALIAFFASVPVYLVSYARDFSGPALEAGVAPGQADQGQGYETAAEKSFVTTRLSQANELYIIAGLISIYVFGYLGSLVSSAAGYAGTGVGAAVTLYAVARYLRSMLRTFRAREEVWLVMGRRHWQFAAYISATLLLAATAVTLRVAYHSKTVTGAAIIIAIFLLYRLRLLMQDLW